MSQIHNLTAQVQDGSLTKEDARQKVIEMVGELLEEAKTDAFAIISDQRRPTPGRAAQDPTSREVWHLAVGTLLDRFGGNAAQNERLMRAIHEVEPEPQY